MFQIVTRQLLIPDFGMFLEEKDTRYMWFNHDSFESNIQFEGIGALCGKYLCLHDRLSVPVKVRLYSTYVALQVSQSTTQSSLT